MLSKPKPLIHVLKFPVLTILLAVLFYSGSGKSNAADSITNIWTDTVNTGATSINTTGAAGNVLDLNPNDTFALNYGGNMRTLSRLSAGGLTYEVLPLTYAVNLIRNTAQATNNILWQSYTSIDPAPAASGIQAFTVTLPGVHNTSMETAFSSGSMDTGTDNLFVNAGDANSNMNNIERLDVYYASGITSAEGLAFPIFERGPGSGHDAFKVAAILSTDGAGNPTSYGPLLSIPTGWGSTSLGTINSLVQRNLPSNPGGGAEFVSAYTSAGQTLGGTALHSVSDLGVSAGTQFFGYSLFGADVNAASHTLTDPSTFPTDTANSPTGGGVDMIASFQAVLAIPEPGSISILTLTGIYFMSLRRRGR